MLCVLHTLMYFNYSCALCRSHSSYVCMDFHIFHFFDFILYVAGCCCRCDLFPSSSSSLYFCCWVLFRFCEQRANNSFISSQIHKWEIQPERPNQLLKRDREETKERTSMCDCAVWSFVHVLFLLFFWWILNVFSSLLLIIKLWWF